MLKNIYQKFAKLNSTFFFFSILLIFISKNKHSKISKTLKLKLAKYVQKKTNYVILRMVCIQYSHKNIFNTTTIVWSARAVYAKHLFGLFPLFLYRGWWWWWFCRFVVVRVVSAIRLSVNYMDVRYFCTSNYRVEFALEKKNVFFFSGYYVKV